MSWVGDMLDDLDWPPLEVRSEVLLRPSFIRSIWVLCLVETRSMQPNLHSFQDCCQLDLQMLAKHQSC